MLGYKKDLFQAERYGRKITKGGTQDMGKNLIGSQCGWNPYVQGLGVFPKEVQKQNVFSEWNHEVRIRHDSFPNNHY